MPVPPDNFSKLTVPAEQRAKVMALLGYNPASAGGLMRCAGAK